jgi:hypothetical protein
VGGFNVCLQCAAARPSIARLPYTTALELSMWIWPVFATLSCEARDYLSP